MNRTRMDTIDELASQILEIIHVTPPIENMDEVVRKIGGVVEEDFIIEESADGTITWNNSGFVIKVSPFLTEGRRNFTIAHELGHLFLHSSYFFDSEGRSGQYYRSGTSSEEYEANEFAAAFLMPKQIYENKMNEYTDNDGKRVNTKKIAEYFNVSVDAASNRGKWLGYLKW